MSLLAAIAFAAASVVTPLDDPAQEKRAQSLEQEIRCVVCENEPISQSTAEIALDMRRLVREQVAAGESDGEIRRFFSDRYGDFVLLRPPVDPRTWALWAAPILLILLGGLAAFGARRASANEAFEPDERPDDR